MKYIHKETGKLYDKLEHSKVAHSVDDEVIDIIIYMDKDGELYVRDKQMFEKEFTPVTCKDCKFYLEINEDSKEEFNLKADVFACNFLQDRNVTLYQDAYDLCNYFQPYQPEPEDEQEWK